MRRFLAAAAIAAISTVAMATSASAVPIKTGLSVVIDGSGSISSTDFNLQKSAYASVFGDSSVLVANGAVVVNVIQFSDSAQVEQTAIRISSEADRTTLINAINAMSQLNGLTAIGDGINLGRSNMDTFLSGVAASEKDASLTKIIDVSTDGGNNSGADPVAATDNAIAGGYSAVNCLAVGAGDCSFMTGDGTVFSATSFGDLEPVLEEKVRQELGTDVPTPSALALLGPALIGLGVAVRRRRTLRAAA